MKEKMKKFNAYGLIRITVAIAIAFAIASLIIFAVSEEPLTAINKLFLGPLQSKRNFFNILETMIPLVFTGLALNIMFRSGLFNMGADGSFYMGAVMASFVAISIELPQGVHQGAVILVAAVVGGLITMLPAVIRKITGANVLVISLMFNYVFFHGGLFIINRFLFDETTGHASFKFQETARLGNMVKGTQLHYGFLIMIVMVIVMYIIVERSKFGYNLKVTGISKRFAKYAGINVTATVILSQFIGGAVAGMGGAIEMVGIYKRFTWNTPVMYVWDGILVNLLGATKPIMIPFAAFFLSYLRVGADVMSRSTDVDNEIVAIIQGIMILLIASERFMYTLKKRKEEREALESSIQEETQVILQDNVVSEA